MISLLMKGREKSVRAGTGYRLENCGSFLDHRHFSLHRQVQTDSAVHQAFKLKHVGSFRNYMARA
jgi:hypothetical protein